MKNIKMPFLLLLLTFCCAFRGVAQTQKTGNLSDDSKVVYNLNEAKKLNGAYIITRSGDEKITLRGSYKDGNRIGNWYAFNDDGNLFLRYNYDQKKLLFLDTMSINRLSVEVITKNQDNKEKATIPVPIVSIDEYISLLGTEARRLILAENKNAEGILDVDLNSKIDAKGNVSYEVAYKADGIPVKKRLIISEKNFDIDWIPANYKGETYPSVFSVKAKINFSERASGEKRFTWMF
ncbi:hypothetical protein EZJ43_00125 [Pedobacter changchengzhani]|uniref:Uncharacterized protein n=1 Tax=Pedobacter changchengzhani TaxID=2529274 RepID=A0A4R5MNX6_9SPHI|nr:hypothetical protein [Pedobacter changchengzhani]TDG37540.1 hypothetical protein EZJ43_00125 [Pedobacter changchengzhani]